MFSRLNGPIASAGWIMRVNMATPLGINEHFRTTSRTTMNTRVINVAVGTGGINVATAFYNDLMTNYRLTATGDNPAGVLLLWSNLCFISEPSIAKPKRILATFGLCISK
jgi:hypothetical protein